jgi:hypothetical protein
MNLSTSLLDMRSILITVWFALAALLTLVPARADPVFSSSTIACTKSALYDASTSGSTKLVTGTATAQIYVCGFNLFAGGTANVKLVYGTGGTCGSGTIAITPAYTLIAQTGMVDHQPYYAGITAVPASNDLCINTSAGVAVQAIVYYTQF